MERINTFLLIDEYHDNYYDFVAEKAKFPLKVVRPSRQYKKKQWAWVEGCFDVLKETSKDDIIICTLDIQAVMCSWLFALLFKKRRIICVNILLKDKNTYKNKIASFFYRKALIRKDIIATVTSTEYGQWLNGKLGAKIELFLLHDVFHTYFDKKYQGKTTRNVFCGGRNGRDWDFMLQVARSLQDVTFNIVVSLDVDKSFKECVPPNVNVLSNVKYDRFYQLLCESLIVCLPLNTEAPAGLLVIFHAAANHKAVVTSDTMVTREYINKDRGIILNNEVQLWRDAILYYLDNKTIREEHASNLLSFLKDHCSEDEYMKGIERLVDTFNS